MAVTFQELLAKIRELRIDVSKRADLERLKAAIPEYAGVDLSEIEQAARRAIEDDARSTARSGLSDRDDDRAERSERAERDSDRTIPRDQAAGSHRYF
jgi:hypothetical protein